MNMFFTSFWTFFLKFHLKDFQIVNKALHLIPLQTKFEGYKGIILPVCPSTYLVITSPPKLFNGF